MDVLRRALPAVLAVLLLSPAAAQAASLHVVFPQSVEATLTSDPAGASTTVMLDVQAYGATRCDATTADVRIDSLYSVDSVGDIAASQAGPMPITTGQNRGNSDNCYIQNPVEVPLTVTIPADMTPGDYTGVVKYGWGGDGDVSADGPKLIVHVLPAAEQPAELPPPELAPPPEIVVLGEREAPKPVLGKSVMLSLVKGKVVYRAPGKSPVELHGSVIASNGTRVDATDGVVKVTVVRNSTGVLDSADVWGTSFTAVQTVPAGRGLTTFTLADKGVGARNKKVASAARKKRKRGGGGNSLWVNGKGNFQTKGKRASAIVMGTFWVTTESDSGTEVKVERGVVGVRDFVQHKNVVLTRGQSYKATPRARPARRVPAFTGSVRSKH